MSRVIPSLKARSFLYFLSKRTLGAVGKAAIKAFKKIFK